MDYLTDTFRDEATNFYNLIMSLAIGKASAFGIIFTIVYFVVFINFLNTLKLEIWQTHGIINMIPDIVIENNKEVQEAVWKRRGVK